MVRTFMAAAALVTMGTAAFAQTTTTKITATASEKMVCKSEAETGSLVAKRKVCKTKADWDREMLRSRDSMTPTQSCRGSDAGTLC